jgi:hypothetical protein
MLCPRCFREPRFFVWDNGIEPDTGYHDAGEGWRCGCGEWGYGEEDLVRDRDIVAALARVEVD